ncbi:MAG: hypothetical protein AAF741_13705 [Bacteroidota bacterium]
MKTILVVLSILGIIWLCTSLFALRGKFYWGHHFTFHNELDIPIDSLMVDVGGLETTIVARDGLDLEGNLNITKSEAAQKVKIVVYSGMDTIAIPADSFNCYNCDGNHHYTLHKNSAEYSFTP